jgi:hypothetical protein
MSKKFGPFLIKEKDENILIYFVLYEELKRSHEYRRKHEWGRLSQH